MSRKTIVPGGAGKIDSLVEHLEKKYKARQFEVQVLQIQDGGQAGRLFQVKDATDQGWLSSVKNMSGLTTAATVKLMIHNQDLEVEVLGGKWLDKVAVGAVSLVVLWPLLITSGIGAWKQNALLDELYESVALYLADSRIPTATQYAPPPPPPAAARSHCPGCGQPITGAMKFCGECGHRLG
jgi:hypothetical protein